MVSKLTLNFICLIKKSLSTSFMRFSSTNRTRPLTAIKSIKWVSIFTMCFSSVYTSYISWIKRVFFWCYHPKMCWINTIRLATDMVYNHSFLNISNKHIIWCSMSPSSFMPKEKSTISVFVEIISPKMALSLLLPELIKSINLIFCISFHEKHLSHSYSLVK